MKMFLCDLRNYFCICCQIIWRPFLIVYPRFSFILLLQFDVMPPLSCMPRGITFFLLFFHICKHLGYLRLICFIKLGRWMPPGGMPGAVAPPSPSSAHHWSDFVDYIPILHIITPCCALTVSDSEHEIRIQNLTIRSINPFVNIFVTAVWYN